MGLGGQPHAQAASTPGKDPVPIVQGAGWAPGPVWTGAKNLVPTGIFFFGSKQCLLFINRLTPNDPYMGRTAPLTPKRCILYIYPTNIGAEYFKHALYSLFFLFKMQFVS